MDGSTCLKVEGGLILRTGSLMSPRMNIGFPVGILKNRCYVYHKELYFPEVVVISIRPSMSLFTGVATTIPTTVKTVLGSFKDLHSHQWRVRDGHMTNYNGTRPDLLPLGGKKREGDGVVDTRVVISSSWDFRPASD